MKYVKSYSFDIPRVTPERIGIALGSVAQEILPYNSAWQGVRWKPPGADEAKAIEYRFFVTSNDKQHFVRLALSPEVKSVEDVLNSLGDVARELSSSFGLIA